MYYSLNFILQSYKDIILVYNLALKYIDNNNILVFNTGDIVSFLEHVEDVRMDLKDLALKEGKHSAKMIESLTQGELTDWSKKNDYPTDEVCV